MKDHFLPSSFSTNGNTHTSWLEFGNNYLKTAAIAILLPLALHVPTKMGGDTQSHSHQHCRCTVYICVTCPYSHEVCQDIGEVEQHV